MQTVSIYPSFKLFQNKFKRSTSFYQIFVQLSNVSDPQSFTKPIEPTTFDEETEECKLFAKGLRRRSNFAGI